jgi:hypothetical protein
MDGRIARETRESARMIGRKEAQAAQKFPANHPDERADDPDAGLRRD